MDQGRLLSNAGIRVLENDIFTIHQGGAQICVVGFPDYIAGHTSIGDPNIYTTVRRIPAPIPVLAITHNPDLFPQIPSRVILTIAGHTHGGQVNLPLVGRPVVPSRFGQKYVAGVIKEANCFLFVTTGLGTSIVPFRLGMPPEIVIIQIH